MQNLNIESLKVLLLIILFFTYYLGCYFSTKKTEQSFFIILFILVSFLFRIVIPFSDNADFYPYAFLRDYKYDLSRPLDDPFLKLTYNVFDFLFLGDKTLAIKCVYWVNYLICTVFFVFLLRVKELVVYKKVFFFSFFYFLFAYTLLRNGPSYVCVALFYFYYIESNFLKKKIKFLWIAVAYHYTALIILFLSFIANLKTKHILIIIGLLLLATVAFFVGFGEVFNVLLDKFNKYSNGTREENLFHVVWFYFICAVFLISFFENWVVAKSKLHLLIFMFFLVMSSINHVAGYRFSIYYLMFYFLVQPSRKSIKQYQISLNLGSIVSIAYFLFSFYETHNR